MVLATARFLLIHLATDGPVVGVLVIKGGMTHYVGGDVEALALLAFNLCELSVDAMEGHLGDVEGPTLPLRIVVGWSAVESHSGIAGLLLDRRGLDRLSSRHDERRG